MNDKEKLEEILTLVKLCPENLQEKCFELLFNNMFASAKLSAPKGNDDASEDKSAHEPVSGDEILMTDVHTKTKALLKSSDITISDINNLFYKENGAILSLYDDLKTTKMAESQMRLALLEAFKNAISSGEFVFDVDTVRTLCDTHKCLDKSNFAVNFKKNKQLFQDEYKKGVSQLSLSAEGKKELARIVSEIAR